MKKLSFLLLFLLLPFAVFGQGSTGYFLAKAVDSTTTTQNYVEVVAANTVVSSIVNAWTSTLNTRTADYPDNVSWEILYDAQNDSTNVIVNFQGSFDQTNWITIDADTSVNSGTGDTTDSDSWTPGVKFPYLRWQNIGAMSAGDTVQVNIFYTRHFDNQ